VCAFAGGWVVVAMHAAGIGGAPSLLAGAAVATGLRVLALWFDWRLPAWRAGE
jgi:uncharacterized membrane protein YeiH